MSLVQQPFLFDAAPAVDAASLAAVPDAVANAGHAPTWPLAELQLARLAEELGARTAGGPLSQSEERLLDAASELPDADSRQAEAFTRRIHRGADPLGDTLCRIRSPRLRRELGAFYTPWSYAVDLPE
jgi:hypothetical protein